MNDRISRFLAERIVAGDFPSAVYLVAEKGAIVFQDALGSAVLNPEAIPATPDTIYDLASLTKVLVTTLLIARMIDDGSVALDATLASHFHEFETDDRRGITIRNLLLHNSGFRGWLPFYLLTEDKSGIARVIAAQALENPVATRVVYSDLNFLILTLLIEKIRGRRLDEIARSEIFEPLSLRETFFNPPAKLRRRIAASEKGNEYEKKTCFDLGYKASSPRSPFRDEVIWGEVHDLNCHFMDGVSGHAGLFSTAVETLRIAQQFLAAETVLLKPETCALFRTNFTPGLNEARSIGFQLASTVGSTAFQALAKDSFGHLGFTGTSLWIEPETERVFILLTNRTHAHPLPFVIINSVRRKFHELATAALGE